jgi:hypothetical protein
MNMSGVLDTVTERNKDCLGLVIQNRVGSTALNYVRSLIIKELPWRYRWALKHRKHYRVILDFMVANIFLTLKNIVNMDNDKLSYVVNGMLFNSMTNLEKSLNIEKTISKFLKSFKF